MSQLAGNACGGRALLAVSTDEGTRDVKCQFCVTLQPSTATLMPLVGSHLPLDQQGHAPRKKPRNDKTVMPVLGTILSPTLPHYTNRPCTMH